MDLLTDTLVNAVVASAATALIVAGLSLIFGVMKVENFAHGEIYMVGAYTTFFFSKVLELGYWVGCAASLCVTALLGVLIEYLLLRPVRKNPMGPLIMTVGVLLVLQTAAVALFGLNSDALVESPFPGVADIAGVTIAWHRIFVIVASLALLSALVLLLQFTRFGRALRAVSQDKEAASLQGISIDRISLVAMGLSTALAGAAGSLMAPITRVGPFMGQPVIITAFVVIIIGGISSLRGAIIASVLYSTFFTFIATYADSTVASIAGLCLMLIVLIVKPSGLIGSTQKV